MKYQTADELRDLLRLSRRYARELKRRLDDAAAENNRLRKQLDGTVFLGMRAIEKWIAFMDKHEPGWDKLPHLKNKPEEAPNA